MCVCVVSDSSTNHCVYVAHRCLVRMFSQKMSSVSNFVCFDSTAAAMICLSTDSSLDFKFIEVNVCLSVCSMKFWITSGLWFNQILYEIFHSKCFVTIHHLSSWSVLYLFFRWLSWPNRMKRTHSKMSRHLLLTFLTFPFWTDHSPTCLVTIKLKVE